MASIETRKILSLYRAFLRELPPLITRPNTNKAFPSSSIRTNRMSLHDHVRSYFLPKNSSHETTRAFKETGQRENIPRNAIAVHLHQTVKYLRAQRSYVELLERYNSGAHEDNQDMVRRTARRVGLDITGT
ncbi:hypothetical protein TWF694_008655 [Orbilia ellipsospora]|uniref:Uncharacterized protein n=1 Tax=Orbilia ellipsospora TaxID=2528407 RepID=A0AAV9XI99_9PEZI